MPDYSFIANPQTSSGLQSLSSIMNTAATAQQMRMNALNIQQKEQTLPADIARVQAESRVATGTEQPRIAAAGAQAQTAQEQARQAHLNTVRAHLGNGVSQLLSLYGKGATPDQVKNTIVTTLSNVGAPPDAINQVLADLPSDPAQIDAFIVNKAKSGLDLAINLDKTFPQPAMVTTGAAIQPLASGNPALTGVPAGTAQGTATPVTLGPSAVETVEVGPDGNKYVVTRSQQGTVLGTRPLGAGSQGTGGGGMPSYPLGVPKSIEANANTVGTHFATQLAQSENAAKNVGVLQEIKKYAPGAVAGVVQDRRAFLTGLAGLVGMDVAQMEKTDTDLLAKNSNMLALAGGDTNLSKTLAEIANPNVHMTKEAIVAAADQVIAQQRMPIIKAQILEKYKTDPQEYTRVLTELNQHTDPRVLQVSELSDEHLKKMHDAMTPQERINFGNSLRFFKHLGYIK